MSEWQPIGTAPLGEVVMTKIDDHDGVRNAQPLVRVGRLWFTPYRRACVYYTPTHWRALATGRPPLSEREKNHG